MTKPFFAYRSFWKELSAKKDFAAFGVKQFCVFAAHSTNSLGEPYSQYEPIWRYQDCYDFAPWDEQMKDTLAICPDAEILCIIDLNSPLWLARMLHVDSYPELSNALACSAWREETEKYLRTFLKYHEEHYGRNTVAYVLVCGKTDEWMDHSDAAETSEKRDLYLEWCQKQGIALPHKDMPTVRQRTHAEHRDGHVRDPEVDREALQGMAFHSDMVASSLLYFAEITRNSIRHEAQIGVFFGYILELGCETALRAHLAYEKVESSEFVDFLISPGDYGDREMGGGGGFMTPNGTLALHHKGCLYEVDHRTHSANMKVSPYIDLPGLLNPWKNLAEDRAGLIREFCRTLFHGASVWWFDMWGGFFTDRENQQVLAKCLDIWKRYADSSFRPDAEVALVVSPESNAYVKDVDMYYLLLKALNRLGAPVEMYSLRDLPKIPQRIRMLLFSHIVEWTPEDAAMLEAARQGRRIFWHGYTALSNGKQWKRQAVPGEIWDENLEVTPDFLKDAARRAGVHLYTDEPCPVWAGRNLLSVHTATGGTKRIALKEPARAVTELFTGKVLPVRNQAFEYEFRTPDTALFKIEL